ncbi:tRNA uridine-5-carboxymethylaminomethyl(34) synthesis GTPase MnmE [Coprococcus eutactus]|uniref:tRNA modification GTPase MnmE n=1 Tax=Coprococcus eutactus TaxID=33043 RepID=A0A3R5WHX6_9FIRM|nr:tRNA uridine-5-carboxymethylaminomethyl(34) synthesis GTPase MnmE [Coprococcus eutactus]
MFKEDTIAAITTGISNAGVGIIRISGDRACEITDRVFQAENKKKKASNMKSYTAAFGKIYDGDDLIDESILLVMKAPHTYTCEDVCELQCHGGIVVLRKILDLVLRNGARAAEPGEFTKRAFLGGRIDMSQAESVMSLINAKNDFAVRTSVDQLQGRLKNTIVNMREKILYNVAFIESALDDPEHYSLDGFPNKLRMIIDDILIQVEGLINTFDNGKILSEGINTVIVGKPNAGKSSLLNMFVGEDRAIVTDMAGTTRDTLSEIVNVRGITLNIIDTAGIRETDDLVEKIGVDKAIKSVDKADLVLYVVDGSVELDENDQRIIEKIRDKNVIVIINKSDLEIKIERDAICRYIDAEVIQLSAMTGDGSEELYDMLNKMFFEGSLSYNDQLYITNARHKNELVCTKNALEKVIESIDMGMEEDFFSIDMMDAYEHLGLIIGETARDDLADKIFKDFCMGK